MDGNNNSTMVPSTVPQAAKTTLIYLGIGESCQFEIRRTASIRVLATMVGIEMNRKYKTQTNRELGKIFVTRIY